MNFQNILSDQTVQQIGWTLIHFLWEAAAAAIVLASVLLWLRKSKATARYIAACATLALMVAVPCITFYCVGKSHVRAEVAADEGAVAVSAAPELVKAQAPAETEPAITHASPSSTSPAGTLRLTEKAKLLLEPALPYLVFGWLAGVFALSLWYVGGWSQLQRYKRKMTSAVSQRDCKKVKELAEMLRIRRAVRVLQSALVQVPTVVGWLRPVILLPASAMTGLSFEQLEAILAHELAHIRRCDYLVNMLQTVVEILGFYHPAVWWVSHKIRVERENCCDDLAVAVCGDKVRYARALALLEEMRADRPRLAVAANAGSLLGRIRRLVGDASKENKSSAWVGAVITLLVLALAIPSTLALSGGSTSKPEKVDARTLFENLRHAQRPVENMRVEFGYETWGFPPGGAMWSRKSDAGKRKYVLWRHDYTALISGRRSRFEWQMRLFRNKDDKEPFQSGRTISVFDGNELHTLAEKSKRGRRSPRDDNERQLLVLLQAIPSDLKDLMDYEDLAEEFDFDVTDGDKPGLYILDAVRKEDDMHWQLTIDGNRGFNNVKTVLFRSDGSDSVERQTNVTLREYPGGIWYPAELEKIDNSAADVGRRIVTTVSAEFDVDVGDDAFELKWPVGTKVFDVFREGHVTIGENGEPEEFAPLSDDRPRPRRTPAVRTSPSKSRFMVAMAQGVTVELVGVCEHPSDGRQWWRPDGRNLAEDARPYQKLNMLALPRNQQENKLLELAVRVTNVDYEPAGITSDAGDRGFRKYGDNIYAATIEVPKNQNQQDITLGMAAGVWETAAISEAAFGRRSRRITEGFAFTEAYSTTEGAAVTITHETDAGNTDFRIVCRDKSGNIHPADSCSSKSFGAWTQTTALFSDLTAEAIGVFEFHTRPFVWVRFSNVSLRPGVHTDVVISAEGKVRRPPARRPQPAATTARPRKAVTPTARRPRPAATPERPEAPAKKDIAANLQILNKHQEQLRMDLRFAEEALEEVRRRYGLGDLEERSYPHHITQRLIRLQQQRDDCLLEVAQLQAKIGILEQEDTPGGKANLKKARDEYIILQNKLAQLRVMCIEARNKNNRLDQARTQYQQRAAIRDERMRALDEIKAQIEKLKIVYEQSKPKVTPRRRDVK